MKAKFLLLALGIAFLTSCSTFKSGQTPDDVYYSPAKQITEEKKEENKVTQNRRNDDYDYEDRALRMRIANGRRWSAFENSYYSDNYRYDYNCNCNCNHYGYNYGWNSWNNQYYGSYYGWNSGVGYYNPVVLVAPSKPKYIAPRGGSYSNGSYNNNTYSNSNNTNTKSGGGRLIDRVFNGGSNNNNNSSSPRAYEPTKSNSSSSSSSSSSGSSSSGGGVSRPARNGN